MKALFNLIDGIDLKDPNIQLRLSIKDEFLVIEERSFKVFRPVTEATHKIPLKNIIATLVTTESEIAEVNKSAIGRGVVGGLIFGPAGLVLGGISGIGKKTTLRKKQLFIVSFLTSGGDVGNITFVTAAVSSDSTTKGFNKYVGRTLKKITPCSAVQKLQTQHVTVDEETEFIL